MSKQYLAGSEQEVEETSSQTQVKPSNSNSEQQKKLQTAAYIANYEQALGSTLGSKLYDSISDLLTMDQMVRYGKDLADSLLDAAVSAASDASDMKLNDAAQAQIVGGLEALLDPIVERMIRSETGMRLTEQLQHQVGTNPYAVAGAGILAAAVAVLTDADLPTLKPKMALGGGFSANGSVELGSIRNIALGATKLGLSYKKEQVNANATISRAKDGSLGGEISGKIGNNERHLKGKVGLSEEGITAFELGGAINLSSSTSLKGGLNGTDPSKIPNWNVQVETDQGDFTHTGNLNYDASTKNLFAKYTGESESLIYYTSLLGNTKTDSLNEFKAGAKYTPDVGDLYSADYQYNFQDQAHQLDLVAQERMGDFSVRGHQRFNHDPDGFRSNTELMGAYHMSNDLALIGGADLKHDFTSGESAVLPKAGIQYKDVPIVLSYDPRTETTSVGITLKF